MSLPIVGTDATSAGVYRAGVFEYVLKDTVASSLFSLTVNYIIRTDTLQLYVQYITYQFSFKCFGAGRLDQLY